MQNGKWCFKGWGELNLHSSAPLSPSPIKNRPKETKRRGCYKSALQGQSREGRSRPKPMQWPAPGPYRPAGLYATLPQPPPMTRSKWEPQERKRCVPTKITPVLEVEGVDPLRLLREEEPRRCVKHQVQSRLSMHGTCYQRHRLGAWRQCENSIDNEYVSPHPYTQQSHRLQCKSWLPSTFFLCGLGKLLNLSWPLDSLQVKWDSHLPHWGS